MDIEFDKDKFDKYRYSVTLGVVTFLGVVISIFAVIMPMYQNASKVNQEEKVTKLELDAQKRRQARLDELITEKDSLDRESKLLSTALPSGKDVGPLFIQLSQLIVDTGGDIKGISGDSNQGATAGGSSLVGLQKYTYTIPISFNDYSSLKSFINESKKALRLIDIGSIVVSAPETGKIDATVTLNTYARTE